MTATWFMPPRAYAGDSIAVSVNAPEFLGSDGWAATLRLIGGGTTIPVTGAFITGVWRFAIAPSDSATLIPGEYVAALAFERSAERQTVAGPTLIVLADPAAAGTASLDLRGSAQRRLDALQAAYTRYCETGELMSSYSIGGRTVTFQSPAELIRMIDHAKREAAGERVAQGLVSGSGASGRIVTRM
jgi:hypothetical protein